jgi:hypothetical protein
MLTTSYSCIRYYFVCVCVCVCTRSADTGLICFPVQRAINFVHIIRYSGLSVKHFFIWGQKTQPVTDADGSTCDIISSVLKKPRQNVQPKTSGNDETRDLPSMKNEYPPLRRETLLYFKFGACKAVL